MVSYRHFHYTHSDITHQENLTISLMFRERYNVKDENLITTNKYGPEFLTLLLNTLERTGEVEASGLRCSSLVQQVQLKGNRI